jgi:hypothetical protein
LERIVGREFCRIMLWVHKTESMVHDGIAVYVLVHIVLGMFPSNMKSCASNDKLDKAAGHTIVPWVVFLFV